MLKKEAILTVDIRAIIIKTSIITISIFIQSANDNRFLCSKFILKLIRLLRTRCCLGLALLFLKLSYVVVRCSRLPKAYKNLLDLNNTTNCSEILFIQKSAYLINLIIEMFASPVGSDGCLG